MGVKLNGIWMPVLKKRCTTLPLQCDSNVDRRQWTTANCTDALKTRDVTRLRGSTRTRSIAAVGSEPVCVGPANRQTPLKTSSADGDEMLGFNSEFNRPRHNSPDNFNGHNGNSFLWMSISEAQAACEYSVSISSVWYADTTFDSVPSSIGHGRIPELLDSSVTSRCYWARMASATSCRLYLPLQEQWVSDVKEDNLYPPVKRKLLTGTCILLKTLMCQWLQSYSSRSDIRFIGCHMTSYSLGLEPKDMLIWICLETFIIWHMLWVHCELGHGFMLVRWTSVWEHLLELPKQVHITKHADNHPFLEGESSAIMCDHRVRICYLLGLPNEGTVSTQMALA